MAVNDSRESLTMMAVAWLPDTNSLPLLDSKPAILDAVGFDKEKSEGAEFVTEAPTVAALVPETKHRNIKAESALR